MKIHNLHLFCIFIILLSTYTIKSTAFESDELLANDEEFEGVNTPTVDPNLVRKSGTKKPNFDSSTSESNAVQFSLEHAFGDSGFSHAGTFTGRLKSWSHGGQTLTKLRFSRNAMTAAEKKAFEKLLNEDDFYTIRVPSNVLNSAGKEYVVSSVRARCIPRESLDEHFVIHTDGVNILAVNYGSAGACPYPRLLKLPTKWSFNSYTILKNGEQARRTPTFTEELIQAETAEDEGVKPPEKSFWAKYWMYLIPLGMIVMNAVTQAMNMPEEEQAGAAHGQAGGTQTQAVRAPPNAAAIRRR